jgi:hypothetical protein
LGTLLCSAKVSPNSLRAGLKRTMLSRGLLRPAVEGYRGLVNARPTGVSGGAAPSVVHSAPMRRADLNSQPRGRSERSFATKQSFVFHSGNRVLGPVWILFLTTRAMAEINRPPATNTAITTARPAPLTKKLVTIPTIEIPTPASATL